MLKPVDSKSIENLLRLTPRIYSGGEPHNEAAFKELARLGIKTIVSVDGAEPNLAAARRYGLRYVHVPIGYDGVPEKARLALARIARDIEGPIFVHCHHGQHRGPAAAAILCIADKAVEPKDADTILKAAKTSQDYAGLWRDVAAFKPPSSTVALPDLVERATVDSFPAAMAKIDRHFDQLKLCREAGWKTPKQHPDLEAQQEALLVYEQLREAKRHLDNQYTDEVLDWLDESLAFAERLEGHLKANDTDKAEAAFQSLQKYCAQCHANHRDRRGKPGSR